MILAIMCCTNASVASSLVYVPVNPSFGGNPLNGAVLLNSAQSQNTIEDPDLEDEESALSEFNDRLQRSLLNRITNTLASQLVDSDGKLLPGVTETSDYIIEVIDLGDGTVSISTVDRLTGESTTFTVRND